MDLQAVMMSLGESDVDHTHRLAELNQNLQVTQHERWTWLLLLYLLYLLTHGTETIFSWFTKRTLFGLTGPKTFSLCGFDLVSVENMDLNSGLNQRKYFKLENFVPLLN